MVEISFNGKSLKVPSDLERMNSLELSEMLSVIWKEKLSEDEKSSILKKFKLDN